MFWGRKNAEDKRKGREDKRKQSQGTGMYWPQSFTEDTEKRGKNRDGETSHRTGMF